VVVVVVVVLGTAGSLGLNGRNWGGVGASFGGGGACNNLPVPLLAGTEIDATGSIGGKPGVLTIAGGGGGLV